MKPTYVYKNFTLGLNETKKDALQSWSHDAKELALIPMALCHFDKDGADVVTSAEFYLGASRHWEIPGLWPNSHKGFNLDVSVETIEKWLTDHANDGKPHVFGVGNYYNDVRVLNIDESGVYWYAYTSEKGRHRVSAYAQNGEVINKGSMYSQYIVFHNAHDAAVHCMNICEKKILALDAELTKHQAEIDAKFAKGNEYVAMLQKNSSLTEKKDPNAWWAMLSPEQKAAMMANNK